MFKNAILFFVIIFCCLNIIAQSIIDTGHVLQFVFTSDAHYGISRPQFRAARNVDAHLVNKAMIEKINGLPNLQLPFDSGVLAGARVGAIDFLVEGGDISNRMEIPIQSASQSWQQFKSDYIDGLQLMNHANMPANIFIIPGNHDISNAIGFYKEMAPATDAATMLNIYNLMMLPAVPKTLNDYHYPNDKINYSRNIGGIHFMFLNLWPDSLERIWMQADLQSIPKEMPVMLFAHDQPECQSKHFSNPRPPYTINSTDKFEGLLTETFKGDPSAGTDEKSTIPAQMGLVAFVKNHPNIVAYFHGNSNYNEFYTYHGPNNDIALPVFRVDSPIKGKYSSKDEQQLSFQLITIDTKSKIMTVRECLWNADPAHPEKNIVWGAHTNLPFNF